MSESPVVTTHRANIAARTLAHSSEESKFPVNNVQNSDINPIKNFNKIFTHRTPEPKSENLMSASAFREKQIKEVLNITLPGLGVLPEKIKILTDKLYSGPKTVARYNVEMILLGLHSFDGENIVEKDRLRLKKYATQLVDIVENATLGMRSPLGCNGKNKEFIQLQKEVAGITNTDKHLNVLLEHVQDYYANNSIVITVAEKSFTNRLINWIKMYKMAPSKEVIHVAERLDIIEQLLSLLHDVLTGKSSPAAEPALEPSTLTPQGSRKSSPPQIPVRTSSLKPLPSQTPVGQSSQKPLSSQIPVRTSSLKPLPSQTPVGQSSQKPLSSQIPVRQGSTKPLPSQRFESEKSPPNPEVHYYFDNSINYRDSNNSSNNNNYFGDSYINSFNSNKHASNSNPVNKVRNNETAGSVGNKVPPFSADKPAVSEMINTILYNASAVSARANPKVTTQQKGSHVSRLAGNSSVVDGPEDNVIPYKLPTSVVRQSENRPGRDSSDNSARGRRSSLPKIEAQIPLQTLLKETSPVATPSDQVQLRTLAKKHPQVKPLDSFIGSPGSARPLSTQPRNPPLRNKSLTRSIDKIEGEVADGLTPQTSAVPVMPVKHPPQQPDAELPVPDALATQPKASSAEEAQLRSLFARRNKLSPQQAVRWPTVKPASSIVASPGSSTAQPAFSVSRPKKRM